MRSLLLSSCWAICWALLVQGVSADDFTCSVGGSSPPAADLVERVEERYRKIHSLRADFSQRSTFVGLDQREESAGQVLFRKPGRMIWDYRSPQPQRFLSDGKSISFFQPSLNQVTLTDFQNTFQSELPVTFLLGIGDLSDAFTVKESCRAADHFMLTLEPKRPDSSLALFSLLIDRSTYAPRGARTRDIGGNDTEIVLSNIDENPSDLPEDLFQISLPRGVDIIDQRAGKGDGLSDIRPGREK